MYVPGCVGRFAHQHNRGHERAARGSSSDYAYVVDTIDCEIVVRFRLCAALRDGSMRGPTNPPL